MNLLKLLTAGLHYPQAWFAIAGYDLRAPVSWSVMPGR